MNLRKTCPDIPDSWRGNVADTCRVLGDGKPISDHTLRKYARLGKARGGIGWKLSKSGKMTFSGKEVKRFWHTYS